MSETSASILYRVPNRDTEKDMFVFVYGITTVNVTWNKKQNGVNFFNTGNLMQTEETNGVNYPRRR